MPELTLPGARIHYEVEGRDDGPAVVLIHAGVASLRMWDDLVPSLAATHRILRYDTRGFGRSMADDGDFSDLDDLLAVMDAAGFEKATLIGASRGGRIAIDAAVEAPRRVTGLVTIGSTPSGFPDTELTERENELFDELDELLAAGRFDEMYRREAELWAVGPTRDVVEVDDHFLQLAYALNAENVKQATVKARPLQIEPPAYDRTVDIEVPALFVIGEHDLAGEIAATEYLLSTVPDSTEARFPDSAHLPSVERPEEFARALGGWLAEHGL
ncbi:alpha/beta fold hydrolase [Frondihabitans australicus]|uniref:Pimeloyl-ACP methyl ester carboxylesterase n=1 Tax=Frondihabitans australicus TaxID=386892 RepID=A0A495IL22_9MICO|nr:alpha/beta fold hydrolase [Frondihabitans australicus]RKR76138.1 pimeloyl-ACP methyl ester carboxylesterase [Frondihabitans australicus]